jgi:hypothetical protein
MISPVLAWMMRMSLAWMMRMSQPWCRLRA